MADVSNEARTLTGHIIAQASESPKDPPLPALTQLSRSRDDSASCTSHSSPPPQPTQDLSANTVLPPDRFTAALTDAVERNASTSRIDQPPPMTEDGGPSPYGTRSRNRNGISRPNYAEDHDVEAEMEWGTSKKTKAASKASAARESQTDPEKLSGVSTRRTSAVSSLPSVSNPAVSQPIKDNLPGMSSFALHPDQAINAAPQSRKRKAPGNTASTATSTQSAVAVRSNGAARRSMDTGALKRETNMMTFEKSGAILQDGRLVADDGTTLEVHGISSTMPRVS